MQMCVDGNCCGKMLRVAHWVRQGALKAEAKGIHKLCLDDYRFATLLASVSSVCEDINAGRVEDIVFHSIALYSHIHSQNEDMENQTLW
ncbi:hypothetical protein V6N13_058862 [Hibiscus sabdariffa]